MTTEVKLYTGQKSKFPRSLPAVDELRFSCAGEGCVTNEKCARWNRIYKEKYRNN
jgi:hypothetical protein